MCGTMADKIGGTGKTGLDSRNIFDLFAAHKREVAAAAVVSLGLAGPAMAGDKPAVSELNGKLETFGGDLDSETLAAFSGSVTAPIGHSLGVQLDGLAADFGGSATWGAGLHGFWRDPDVALAGLTVAHLDIDGTGINRYGVEVEYYLGPVTFAGTVGYQNGDSFHTGWGGLDLRYYPFDNLMVEAGGSAISGERAGHLGVEWQVPLDLPVGVSLFADAARGTGDYGHVLGGIRIYFGGSKPLKSRHREDDPVNMLLTGISQVASSGGGSSAGAGFDPTPPGG